jgi:prepilin-type processing-associated H-X9-DG protein
LSSNFLGRFETFGSAHPGEANLAWCDGSVRFMSNAVNGAPALANRESFLEALCTRAGGEAVDVSRY